MARRRMIEVSIAHDKEFNRLSDFAQLLFLKVLPHTDDFGRFEGDPETVKARVDPLSSKRLDKYENAMREIADSGLWWWFKTPEGKTIIQYKQTTFERINAFLIKSRGNSEFPSYKEGYESISNVMPCITNRKTKAISIKQKVESKEQKETWGEFKNVLLSQKEYEGLSQRLGSNERANVAIEILSAYKESKGKQYKSDYATFSTWVIKELEKRESNGNSQQRNGQTGYRKSGAGGETTEADLRSSYKIGLAKLDDERTRSGKTG